VKDEKSNGRIEEMKMKFEKEGGSSHLGSAAKTGIDLLVDKYRRSRPRESNKVVIDMDSFYYSCALARHKEEGTQPSHQGVHLNQMPVVVGGGMILTSNYEARKYGVRSAMAGFIADKLVAELSKGKVKLLHLKSDHKYYAEKSAQVRSILEEYDPNLKQYSLDEFYIDLTAHLAKSGDGSGDVQEVVSKMRARVLEECFLSCSAGIAPSSVLAKICSDLNKPDGQYHLPPGDDSIMDFMRQLDCRKVPGVGRVSQKFLAAFGIENCAELYARRYDIFKIFKEKTAGFLLRASVGGWGGEDEDSAASFGAGEDQGQKGIR
jgi:DNA polymerase kappa